MNYQLKPEQDKHRRSAWSEFRSLWPLLIDERNILGFAAVATLCNSLINLAAPLLIAYIVDNYVTTGNFGGMLKFATILLLLYIAGLFTSYAQTRLMGGVGQRVLFNLRTKVFSKLQDLPLAFFNDNKTGDLISRINNDTDKLNLFFSQTLVQFVASLVIMFGAALFLLSLNFKLGAAGLLPAAFLLLFTRLVSPAVKRRNTSAAASNGGLSAEVAESLNNFKVIVAFNRRDFFCQRFAVANDDNYRTSIGSGVANTMFMPVFGLASNLAQLTVLVFGLYLITRGELTIGLLIGFLAYITTFYNPLRQLAALWGNFQVAMAGWDRISAILHLQNDMRVLPVTEQATDKAALLEFRNVSFSYAKDQLVLRDVSFGLERGKTYALVGPTGGGKTTTASLMARLYDPTAGSVWFCGRDLRTFTTAERTRKIGFILQDPTLFSGTIRENIVYSNQELATYSNQQLIAALDAAGLSSLLVRFDGGLDATVAATGDSLSLGQKQLIAFMRAVLRNPDLLILDEATANIDTVTEQLLEEILRKLPGSTTRVIIAHRLNTIENADEIFFVNSARLTPAGSMQDAVNMLLNRSHADEPNMTLRS